MVDVLFEPNREKSRTSVGLLGELTLSPCIIEIFRPCTKYMGFKNIFASLVNLELDKFRVLYHL
jgi:hypothetical protein